MEPFSGIWEDEVTNFQIFEKTLNFSLKYKFFDVNLKNRTFLKII